MLEEHEWIAIEPLLMNQANIIKKYREENDVDIKTATQKAFMPATEMYFKMTGFKETNYAAIYHHRLIEFGPECKKCGHLFRTTKASFCANCGQKAKENV